MHMESKELPLVFTSAEEKVYFYSYNLLIWVSFNIILFYFFFFPFLLRQYFLMWDVRGDNFLFSLFIFILLFSLC